jgi:hypothetical protein
MTLYAASVIEFAIPADYVFRVSLVKRCLHTDQILVRGEVTGLNALRLYEYHSYRQGTNQTQPNRTAHVADMPTLRQEGNALE